MSQENMEIVRRTIEALQAGMERGDYGAAWDEGIAAVDAEWVVPEGFEGRTVWVGREGFVEFMRTWTEQFEGWSFQVDRLIDAGDEGVVGLTRQWATGKESGVPVELNLGQVYELRRGRITRFTNYLTHTEALERGGLRLAWRAPRGPEVDQHPLAPVVGDLARARRSQPRQLLVRRLVTDREGRLALAEQAESEQADDRHDGDHHGERLRAHEAKARRRS